jgi:hypothetical protein
MASVKLEATLMNKIENVRPTLYSDFGVQSTFGNYKPTPSWECPDLISAIYLQLYLCRENESSLRHGWRILSSYPVGESRIWIITEADRSVTTILLPEEY